MMFTMLESGFAPADYVLFVSITMFSCLGGFWVSFSSNPETPTNMDDYLFGGRQMKTIPIAFSLIGSYISGTIVLGTPAEIFNYGPQYWLVIFGLLLSCIIVAKVYLPVFRSLNLSSTYEYLELRFNIQIRAIASILFLLDELMFIPIILYTPALAFKQLTGLNVYGAGAITICVCSMYTALGGIRAVVWTDVVQTSIMFGSVVIVAVAGTAAAGGCRNIFDVTAKHGRLDLSNWDLSPVTRQTGWGAVVGGTLYWTCFNSVNQMMVQRYIALPTERKSLYALSLYCLGVMFAISLLVWCGLTAFTVWASTGCAASGCPLVRDSMLPAFAAYLANDRQLHGISGILLAGVFGAGLSSLSTRLNALALVVVEDIMHGCLLWRPKVKLEVWVARIATLGSAVIAVALLVVVVKLGGILGVRTALSAIATSTTCGVFTLGMACWWVGPRGALAGALSGALTAGITSIGIEAAALVGFRHPAVDIKGECARNASYKRIPANSTGSDIFPLFRISYHWVAPLGLIVTLVVGAIVGYFFDKPKNRLLDLYTPLIWRWLPEETRLQTGEMLLGSREELRQSLPTEQYISLPFDVVQTPPLGHVIISSVAKSIKSNSK